MPHLDLLWSFAVGRETVQPSRENKARSLTLRIHLVPSLRQSFNTSKSTERFSTPYPLKSGVADLEASVDGPLGRTVQSPRGA